MAKKDQSKPIQELRLLASLSYEIALTRNQNRMQPTVVLFLSLFEIFLNLLIVQHSKLCTLTLYNLTIFHLSSRQYSYQINSFAKHYFICRCHASMILFQLIQKLLVAKLSSSQSKITKETNLNLKQVWKIFLNLESNKCNFWTKHFNF